MKAYISSIGLEVHAELETRSKMFCRCKVEFGGEPNTRVCPVCLGMPGTLPVPNQCAIELVLKTAVALNCKIAMESIFHRKNYFYPDLPKGYQISQYGDTNPIGYNGWVEIPTTNGYKKIVIQRVHLEEDTGKLMHLPSGGSGVDYNRAGVPLMEIVTAFPPDVEGPEEAKEYLTQLRQLLVYLGVCNGKMEEGSMRCEPNISIRKQESTFYGTKTELKNLNSFRSVQLGIGYEVQRQTSLLEKGEKVFQETRGWDDTKLISFSMRAKEQENDYRYFPEPDIPPLKFTQEQVDQVRQNLPELPLSKYKRYQEEYGLSKYDAALMSVDRETADYFEKTIELGGNPKAVCNWMSSDLSKLLNESGLSLFQSLFTPSHLKELIELIDKEIINGKIAKTVIQDCFKNGDQPTKYVEESGLAQVTNTDEILQIVLEIIKQNPGPSEKYRSGQTNILGFFVGQVIKQTAGKANPSIVQKIVSEELKKI